jgi:WhiB family redox-sensing transcriptional regulator
MAIQAWRDEARCVGMPNEMFFPEKITDNRFDAALKVCAGCPVTYECLMLVVNLDDVDDRWGVFGDTTPKERRNIRDLMQKVTVREAMVKVHSDR